MSDTATDALLAIDADTLLARIEDPAHRWKLRPPPRFAAKTFANYRCDPAIDGQEAAVAAVRAFAEAPPRRWFRRQRGTPPGLYLDGDFGVGKTHLLAATWQAARGRKQYLSFAEAIDLVTLEGIDGAAGLLAADLVCIDEFELDDPAETRIADRLLAELVRRRSRICTTSNTVPGELGQGRLFVDQFRAQLQRIGEHFTDIHVPGIDYRREHAAEVAAPPRPASAAHRLSTDQAGLDRLLLRIPQFRLRRLPQIVGHLDLVGLAPFTDPLAALRFVNCIDRCYNFATHLTLREATDIDQLFPPQHCLPAFAKKYRRCQSRLAEMLQEGRQA